MKIVVAVKQVANIDDEEFELTPDERSVDLDYIERDLNEWDAFSLEAALALKDARDDVEVVAVTVGDQDAEEVLLSSLAKGADRAVRIDAGELPVSDPLAVARVLASAIDHEAPDLVLCGVQASDTVNGATGVALGEFLGLERVAVVRRIELDPAAHSVTVERELEGGLAQRLRVLLPALLTVQTGINEPRYATLRAIKQARDKPLEEYVLSDLGLIPDRVAAGGRLRRLIRPQEESQAMMIKGGPAAVAARIVELVRDPGTA